MGAQKHLQAALKQGGVASQVRVEQALVTLSKPGGW